MYLAHAMSLQRSALGCRAYLNGCRGVAALIDATVIASISDATEWLELDLATGSFLVDTTLLCSSLPDI